MGKAGLADVRAHAGVMRSTSNADDVRRILPSQNRCEVTSVSVHRSNEDRVPTVPTL